METKNILPEQITFEMIKDLMPEYVSLVYVDYRDSLDEHEDVIDQIVSENSVYPITEKMDYWFCESMHYSMGEYRDEIREKIKVKFDLEEGEAADVIENLCDEINDYLWDKDDSTPVRDLISNTGKQVFFYDTGWELPSDSWNMDDDEIKEYVDEIKGVLGIDYDKLDSDIDMMVRQASYGGQLVIHFYAHIQDLLSSSEDKDFSKIRFHSNCSIAIINKCNGSGDDCCVDLDLTLPFDRSRLFHENSIKYNYSFAVCGMYSNWCDNTCFELLEEKEIENSDKETTMSPIQQEKLLNKQYDEVYKAGGCSFGDMDIRRHRNVEYINNFPCGSKCKDCGTFLID